MTTIWLEQWGADDLPVLERSNTPEMTVFLGGPETSEQLTTRHARFLHLWETGEARMFRIMLAGTEQPVGSVGYWKKHWNGQDVYETGWSVHSAYQGQGVASRALVDCVHHAAVNGDRELVVAFPRTDNSASNALCRRVGFTLHSEVDFEYPKGNPIRSNAWVYELPRQQSD